MLLVPMNCQRQVPDIHRELVPPGVPAALELCVLLALYLLLAQHALAAQQERAVFAQVRELQDHV